MPLDIKAQAVEEVCQPMGIQIGIDEVLQRIIIGLSFGRACMTDTFQRRPSPRQFLTGSTAATQHQFE